MNSVLVSRALAVLLLAVTAAHAEGPAGRWGGNAPALPAQKSGSTAQKPTPLPADDDFVRGGRPILLASHDPLAFGAGAHGVTVSWDLNHVNVRPIGGNMAQGTPPEIDLLSQPWRQSGRVDLLSGSIRVYLSAPQGYPQGDLVVGIEFDFYPQWSQGATANTVLVIQGGNLLDPKTGHLTSSVIASCPIVTGGSQRCTYRMSADQLRKSSTGGLSTFTFVLDSDGHSSVYVKKILTGIP